MLLQMHWPGGLCIAWECGKKEKSPYRINYQATGIFICNTSCLLVLLKQWLKYDNLAVSKNENEEDDSSTYSSVISITGCIQKKDISSNFRIADVWVQ